jgi:hypothetical protein
MNTDTVYLDVAAMLYADLARMVRARHSEAEYARLAGAAHMLYRDNTELRSRLADLEQLASSWTGVPAQHAPIAEARKLLRMRPACLVPAWKVGGP